MKKQDLESGNTNTTRLSIRTLQEIKTNLGRPDLDTIIEVLENTIDPDPSELYLLESLYQLREKIALTGSRIETYLKKRKDRLPENKLDDLYDNTESIGSSKIFKY